MKDIYLVVLLLMAGAPMQAAIRVPLTVEEALYPGSAPPMNRTADPVTVGVPLPDNAEDGATDVHQLTLEGARGGQFRVLGRWPSGRIKWVLVDTQADVAAGHKDKSISLTDVGSGNFGGPDLAVDNGSTITVATGTATFTIRKAHFNGIDEAIVADTVVVAAGTSQGLVVNGPAPGETSCPPCTTLYASTNDPNSSAVIEENGPVKAVIKATGSHVDASGNTYMRFTVRLSFYKDKSFVRVVSVLRNADHGASNTFATAYKGHQGYELRISPRITGATNYSIGNHTSSPSKGSLEAGEGVYLSQASSQLMKWQDWCGFGCLPYTKQTGYSIVKNGATVVSGSDVQYPQGWADVQDNRGVGVTVGIYQMAAYGPKSLELLQGGSDVRIGIWSSHNDQPYYQPWPQWSIHELYVNFHATAPSSPAGEFLKFQHPLLGRAAYTHYNTTAVFPYPLIDPVAEDAFYINVRTSANPATLQEGSACCIQDLGTVQANWPLNVYRFYAWGSGGGSNQTEFRWSRLLNFLTRGMTGRYLDSAHFYRFLAESVLPHSDGFDWRDKPGEHNGFGQPNAESANSALGFRNWRDQEHGHWYGMTDYYFMTGDETVREAMLDQQKDWFLNPRTYQNGQSGGLFNTRSIGIQLMGAARFAGFLAAIGDPDAEKVLKQGKNTYLVQVKPELCVSGYPEGCVLGPADGGPWNTQGVSRTRGVPWGASGTSGTWCGLPKSYRVNSGFQPSVLIAGLLEFRNAAGADWPEYWNALDLAYGMARWNISENYVDDGSGRWDINGFRFGIALDVPNSCLGPGESPEPNFKPTAMQTVSMTFFAKHLVDGDVDWAQKFKINLQKTMAALGMTTSDFGSYQITALIAMLNAPRAARLEDVAIDSVADNGGGSYTIAWTVPTGARSYRIKWAGKRIVDWIGFDPATNTFVGDPSGTIPWFAAENVSDIPAPEGAGSIQTITIQTGAQGLTAANFSVKGYIGKDSGSGVEVPRVRLLLSSGDGQKGTVGQALPMPLKVRAATTGTPVAGIEVTFTAVAGGGTLSVSKAMTDEEGFATTMLTLGSTPGTNTVIAEAPLLAGSPVTFTATASALVQPGNGRRQIRWTLQPQTEGWPGYNGWLTLWFDPLSTQTILYGVTAPSTTIYSTDIFFYNADTNRWTHRGGTGNKAGACPASSPSWPGDRHPGWQMTIDSKRNALWLMGGVCQGAVRQDMYYLELNTDPMRSEWHQVSPAHYPASNISSAMAYDTDNDVLFLFGSDGAANVRTNWLYCPTIGTAEPGTLTAKQMGAGCTAADDWTLIQPAGGVQPKAVAFPGIVYDSATKQMILFGGMNGGLAISYNETWAYDVRAQKWTQKALGSTPPPVYNGSNTAQPAMTYDSTTHKVLYHQTSNAGAPADWEYDPTADSWTKLESSGGATIDQYISYDPKRNVVIGFSRNTMSFEAEVWIGTLTEAQ